MMKLVNNLEIPDIGLGVYKISEKEMNEVISLAYQDGYKLFDTAQKLIELDSNRFEGYYYNALALFESEDVTFAIEN